MRLRVVDHGEDTPDVGSEFARNPCHHLRVLLLVELQNKTWRLKYSAECIGRGGSRISRGRGGANPKGAFS